jgi:hypothetical protein
METARAAGDRNRGNNPAMTDAEAAALALFLQTLTPEPNPWVGDDGAPRLELLLPDEHQTHPRQGLATFSQRCASCHPPPLLTTDQEQRTRGRTTDVGTPHLSPLRPELQDSFYQGFPAPSLLGAWKVFPMLSTGAGGLSARDDGLAVTSRCALCEVLEHYSGPEHGNAEALSREARDNLLGYLLSL